MSLQNNVKFILDFYYGNIELSTIKIFTEGKEEKFDINDSIEIFQNFNLTTFERDISIKDIPQHFLPSIIFNEEQDSITLLEIKEQNALVYLPSENIKKEVSLKSLKKFKHALLIFKEIDKKKSTISNASKKWFYDPLKAHWRTYIEVGILTLFINFFALAIPLFVMSTYDRVVPNKAYATLFVLAVGTLIILIFDLILKYSRNYILEKFSKKLGHFWEEELMRKMILTNAHFDNYMTGTKANLFKELQQVRDFFTIRSLMQVIDLPFFFIGITVIYIISPTLASIPLVFSIIIIGFNLFMQIPIAKLGKGNSENQQSKNSFIFESIQGAESIKTTNSLSNRIFMWRNIVAFADSIAMRMQSLHVFSMNMSQFFVQLVVVCVIVTGVFEISAQQLSIGGLIAITILSSRTIVPIVNLSGILIRLKEIGESVNRIDEFLALPSENSLHVEAGLGTMNGKIEFKNVNYRFQSSKYNSIENISFTINPGEKVGIIGQTGAGKSTLLKLILKLINSHDGSIFLDNHDISTLHTAEIRQNIGVMPQDPFLFNGSIKDNIAPSVAISKAKMMEIIQLTGLEDLIKKSGQGDGLQVGERGLNLSVGQRHLVTLARALVNEPAILILDEPTTGLDIGLEKKLIANLQTNLKKEQTVLVITHRLTALQLVDRVIVMDDGKIIADGPKEKILNLLQSSTRSTL